MTKSEELQRFINEMDYTLKDKIKQNRKYAPQVFYKNKYTLEKIVKDLEKLEKLEKVIKEAKERFDSNYSLSMAVWYKEVGLTKIFEVLENA